MSPPSMAFRLATKWRLPPTTAVFHPRKDASSAFFPEGGYCFERKRLQSIFEFNENPKKTNDKTAPLLFLE
jgi:hypothetical protein